MASFHPQNVCTLADSEIELIALASAGDQEAFERLYQKHLGRVYAICLRMTANESAAEELTQKTFIKIWETLPGFRGDGAFGGWVARIAVNTVLIELRSTKRRQARVFAAPDIFRYDVGACDFDAAEMHDLEKAIFNLPPQARQIFVLHDIEGYKHREIADMLNIASGTSKAQLHRARNLLREALQG